VVIGRAPLLQGLDDFGYVLQRQLEVMPGYDRCAHELVTATTKMKLFVPTDSQFQIVFVAHPADTIGFSAGFPIDRLLEYRYISL
jgi:hypothetical protein